MPAGRSNHISKDQTSSQPFEPRLWVFRHGKSQRKTTSESELSESSTACTYTQAKTRSFFEQCLSPFADLLRCWR